MKSEYKVSDEQARFQKADDFGKDKRKMSTRKKCAIATGFLLVVAAIVAVIVYFAAFHNKVSQSHQCVTTSSTCFYNSH